MICSSPICAACLHTHTFEGTRYGDCPWCSCATYSPKVFTLQRRPGFISAACANVARSGEGSEGNYLEKVSQVGGVVVTLYSRDGEHWCSSVRDLTAWERAQERKRQKVASDYRAIFNPKISGRAKKSTEE